MPLSTGTGLERVRIARPELEPSLGRFVGFGCCAPLQEQERKRIGGGSPVAAPMPKSVFPVEENINCLGNEVLVHKCQPFFQILKKAFQWDARCEEAFAALSPILVSTSEGELLTMYLAVSDFSTSVVLIRDKDRVQRPVYYCSRALRRAEERYPKMEKLILALVTTAGKLRPYFQAHTIEIPIEYPMKQVLHKLETSGRLMKWAIELSEFDIRYKPKTTIKGQILADFVMEFTSAELA